MRFPSYSLVSVPIHLLRLHDHLLDAGIDAFIGTVVDALDNALMEFQISSVAAELTSTTKAPVRADAMPVDPADVILFGVFDAFTEEPVVAAFDTDNDESEGILCA